MLQKAKGGRGRRAHFEGGKSFSSKRIRDEKKKALTFRSDLEERKRIRSSTSATGGGEETG